MRDNWACSQCSDEDRRHEMNPIQISIHLLGCCDSSGVRWKNRSLLINWCFSFLLNAHWCPWHWFQRRISFKMLTAISRVSNQASTKPLIYLFNAWGRSAGRQRVICLSISTPETPESLSAAHRALGWIKSCLDADLHRTPHPWRSSSRVFTASSFLSSENFD